MPGILFRMHNVSQNSGSCINVLRLTKKCEKCANSVYLFHGNVDRLFQSDLKENDRFDFSIFCCFYVWRLMNDHSFINANNHSH